MKKVKLKPYFLNKYALVDDEDYEWVSQFTWHTHNAGYAMRRVYFGYDGKRQLKGAILLHRDISTVREGQEVDHINGNPLDNRQENLRICTHAQNMMNRRKQKNNSSGVTGVGWRQGRNKWRSEVMLGGKHYHVGYFATQEEATLARNKKVKELHGEFAVAS